MARMLVLLLCLFWVELSIGHVKISRVGKKEQLLIQNMPAIINGKNKFVVKVGCIFHLDAFHPLLAQDLAKANGRTIEEGYYKLIGISAYKKPKDKKPEDPDDIQLDFVLTDQKGNIKWPLKGRKTDAGLLKYDMEDVKAYIVTKDSPMIKHKAMKPELSDKPLEKIEPAAMKMTRGSRWDMKVQFTGETETGYQFKVRENDKPFEIPKAQWKEWVKGDFVKRSGGKEKEGRQEYFNFAAPAFGAHDVNLDMEIGRREMNMMRKFLHSRKKQK